MRLEGRIALITGGASSFGRAIAVRFAAEGARVVVADKDEAAGQEVVETVLHAGGDATFSLADVREEDQVQAMIGDAVVAYGNLDILVNTVALRITGDALGMTAEELRESIHANLETAWICSRSAAPFLKSTGRGAIVTLAPTDVFQSMPRRFPYAVGTGALPALSRGLAIDLGPQGIRSNLIVTGFIDTEHTERWLQSSPDPEELFRRVLAAHPLGRVGTADDVARAAAFLVSEDAAFITGTTLVVDGGRSAAIQELHNWA